MSWTDGDPQRTVVVPPSGPTSASAPGEAGVTAGPAPMGPEPRLARYEVLEILGHGAMGVVYKARDRELERLVAIKTIRSDGPARTHPYAEERRRLCREAMAAARLGHRGIVAIHDVIVVDEIPHVVMEYVRGRTLAQLIAESALPVDDAVRLVLQVCRAVEYAHAEGVVHRDIKSSNIIVDSASAAKLGDFGVARIVGKQNAESGVVIGTPAYMAPEQLSGGGADERSDLFSLGVVLYEAVTGRSPFPGDDVATVLYEIAHGTPVPAREHNPEVWPALDTVIMRALNKEPTDRYPTARALAEALEQALAAPHGRLFGLRLWPRPLMARFAIAAAAVLVVAAGLGTMAAVTGAPRPGAALPAPPRIPVAMRGGFPVVTPAPAAPRPVAAVLDAGAQAPKAQTGTIVIETNPAVDVFVDGALRGRTRDRALVVRDVPVGAREITLQFGERERTLAAKLRDGQTLTLAFTFGEGTPAPPAPAAQASTPKVVAAPPKVAAPPAPAPKTPATAVADKTPPEPATAHDTVQSFGCLSVNAVPFAAVYVDGQHLADTPRACLRVRTGSRQVRFESSEGQSPERTVVVTAAHTADDPMRVSYDFHAREFIGP